MCKRPKKFIQNYFFYGIFLNNVENSMIMLLRHPVEVLDDCAFKIKKIKQGTWRGR